MRADGAKGNTLGNSTYVCIDEVTDDVMYDSMMYAYMHRILFYANSAIQTVNN